MVPALEKSIALLGEEKERRRKTLSYAPLGRTPPPPAEGARKNNALRKNRSEGYKAKENRLKGALLIKCDLERSLKLEKVYVQGHEKAKKPFKTRIQRTPSSNCRERVRR